MDAGFFGCTSERSADFSPVEYVEYRTTLLCAFLFHGVEMTDGSTGTMFSVFRHSLLRHKVRMRRLHTLAWIRSRQGEERNSAAPVRCVADVGRWWSLGVHDERCRPTVR
jgi:hypothetical protein